MASTLIASVPALVPSPSPIYDFTHSVEETIKLIGAANLTAQVNASLANCFDTIFNTSSSKFTEIMTKIGQSSKDDNRNYATVIATANVTPRVFLALGQLKWRDPGHDNKPMIVNLCVNPDHRSGGWGQAVVHWLEYIGKQAGLTHLYLQPETATLVSYYQKMGYAPTSGGLMVKAL